MLFTARTSLAPAFPTVDGALLCGAESAKDLLGRRLLDTFVNYLDTTSLFIVAMRCLFGSDFLLFIE